MKRITPFPKWLLRTLTILGVLYFGYVLTYVSDPVLKVAFGTIALIVVLVGGVDLYRAAKMDRHERRSPDEQHKQDDGVG